MSYSTRLEEAFALAADLHRQQVRKGTSVPYITHVMAVAALVGGAGGSEDEVIAALLHDVVEDQGGLPTLDLVRDRFGTAVADIVAGCSDAFGPPKPPWRERKEAFLERLREASQSVRLVVTADKLHNARAVVSDLRVKGPKAFEVFRGGRDGTLWYFREVIALLRAASPPPPLLGDLERAVGEMVDLAGPATGPG
jgi:(p)ppGpp synthase/HD superfamily hydrolase